MPQPTFEQIQRLIDLVGKYFDVKSIEWLLGETGHLSALADLTDQQLRDLDLRDKELLKLITQDPDDLQWSEPSTYAGRFGRWNHHFNFGIPMHNIHSLGDNRPQSLDKNVLYSLGFNFGGSLISHWNTLLRILQFEIAQYDLTLEIELDPQTLMYRDDRNGFDSQQDRVYGTDLNIGQYCSEVSGLPLCDVLEREPLWPSFEVLWLLVQNAHILRHIDAESIPNMYLPGFTTSNCRVPIIGCDGETVFIASVHETCLTYGAILPAYVRQPPV